MGGLLSLPQENVSVTKINDAMLIVRYENVPCGDKASDMLDFVATFHIDGECVRAKCGIQLHEESDDIVERVLFPTLALLPLSKELDDNVLFYPLTGGALLRNPGADFIARNDTTYPGHIVFQAMAYYSEQATGGGGRQALACCARSSCVRTALAIVEGSKGFTSAAEKPSA